MAYNWQLPDWPDFKYDLSKVFSLLMQFSEEIGHAGGMLKTLPENLQLETLIDTLITEAIKTSEIEGEYLSRKDVASSIRNNLGLNAKPEPVKDKLAGGAGKLMVDVRKTFNEPLNKEKLYEWHTTLFAGSSAIRTGAWRGSKQPMRVLSEAIGKEKVHFEASPSISVPKEMKRFIQWFNETAPEGLNPIASAQVRAAIAHLYFESIHPFEDGNGRIGRAIAEKALSQTSGRPLLLSLSAIIEAKKSIYYQALESAQQNNEVTEWVTYFVQVCLDAQKHATQTINFIVKKAVFFERYKSLLNARQLKVINKMLDAGIDGFTGGMNAMKYISITKTSKATATRDLQYLADGGILVARGGGRSTHYILNI